MIMNKLIFSFFLRRLRWPLRVKPVKNDKNNLKKAINSKFLLIINSILFAIISVTDSFVLFLAIYKIIREITAEKFFLKVTTNDLCNTKAHLMCFGTKAASDCFL
jgi:hypothetical protein